MTSFTESFMGLRNHREVHRNQNVGWLRAAVLGANDGLLSTSGLIVGMASAGASLNTMLLSAVAALTAGAFSMASGEYVSVSSQADSESAERELEKRELANNPAFELEELRQIYVQRGLQPDTAKLVAEQLTAHNALDAHLRDELGITEHSQARPVQAALSSAAAFGVGAALPIMLLLAWHGPNLVTALIAGTLILLAALGALAARLAGAPVLRGGLRVLFWGALAMAASAGIGRLFGTSAVG